MTEAQAPHSEAEVIGVLRRVFHQGRDVQLGIGDDAAVLAPAEGAVLVSTDMLVEGVDFDRSWASCLDIGWKSAAVNISDIAAMGAEPNALVVSLEVPPQCGLDDIEELARGVQEAIDALAPGAAVVGGDLSSGAQMAVSVTVLGRLAAGEHAVTRAGARPGDVLAYWGKLGYAAAGLAVLRGGQVGSASAAALEACAAQLRPRPSVEAGRTAREYGATAMMDVSDGLAVDASRMAGASEVTIRFDPTAFPKLVTGLGWTRYELGLDPWALVFAGGEDFGLLATFPADDIPDGFLRLGTVESPAYAPVLLGDRTLDYPEWDHFSGKRR